MLIETPYIISIVSKSIANSYKTSNARVTIPLTLKDLITNYELSSDEEEIRADLYEVSPRLINPKRISLIKDFFPIGIDTSSRAVITPTGDIILSAVSISGQGPVELCDWPYLYTPMPYMPKNPAPFIYIASSNIELPSEVGGLIYRTGFLSDVDDVSRLMDYARLRLESWGLLEPSMALGKYYLGIGKKFVVFVDGPIYLLEGKRDDMRYSLMEQRAEAIKTLENVGIPVIGIVKRVERSRLLSMVSELRNSIENCIGNYQGFNDSLIIQKLLYSSCFEESYGKIYVSPKIRLKYNGLEKIAEYILIPSSGYKHNFSQSRLFRLEYTERSYNILKESGMDPIQLLANDSIVRQSLEPLTIAQSDRRSKMITQALKELLVYYIMRYELPLSYDTLREAELQWLKKGT
ncbi:MAG: DNA double-strand break repair nuclease NurA [Caldisphaeraceae archaeon]|nr:DNA double-strand break repair nuclease NurA [Caldisphaeraceae archaeon]